MSVNRLLGVAVIGILGCLSALVLSPVTAEAGVATAEASEGQLGGLIRRGREAIKAPPEQPVAPATAKPADKPTTAPATDPFADPYIVPITADQHDRFNKALRFELDKRNEFAKFLSGLPDPEKHRACSQTVATSPEAMKISQDWADRTANLTAIEEIQKSQEVMSTDLGALLTSRCGTDPGAWQDSRRAERLREIEAEAAVVAMPPEWTPPAKPVTHLSPAPGATGSVVHLALLQGPGAVAYVALLQGATGAMTSPGGALIAMAAERAYAMLKERIPKFCFGSQERTQAPPQGVTQLPGDSGAVWYVYTEAEVKAMTRERCDVTINLWTFLVKPTALGLAQ